MMYTIMIIGLTTYLLLISLNCSNAKILSGHLLTSQNWAFLARFCFLSERGKFQYKFILEEGTNVNLLLYYDSPSQWPSVYPSNKTCLQKEAILDKDHGQIVPLTVAKSNSTPSLGCFNNKTTKQVRCISYREFRSNRPRWWFIALSDCTSRSGLNVTYWISLTNGPPGSFWKEHFSADEFYILPLLIVFAIVYLIIMISSIIIALELRSRRLLHVSYKLFMLSLWCYLTGIIFEIYGYIIRAALGIDLPKIILTANLFEACSETLFAVLLLLLALGFTITKSVLSSVLMWRLLGFVWINTVLQLSIFIYQSEVFDPGLVLYIYESPPGYGLLALKIWIWIIFMFCSYRTCMKAKAKLHFYSFLISLGSGWFLFHPLVVLVITFLIDKWIRESVTKGCSLWIMFLGHAFFLYAVRPAATNIHFPFHIRTFQVVPAIVEDQGHCYEPRNQTSLPVFTLQHLNRPQDFTNCTTSNVNNVNNDNYVR